MKENKETIPCVMCGEMASFYGRPTNEPLCEKCNKINEEILYKRSMGWEL